MFCYYLGISIVSCDEFYKNGDSRGSFNPDDIRDCYNLYIDLKWCPARIIASDLNMPEITVRCAKARLVKYGLIRGETILIPEGIEKPFIQLRTESGLNGLPLIVYSYIVSKCEKYNNVDKYRRAMADELGISERQLIRVLKYLRDNGKIKTEQVWRSRIITLT